MSYIKDLINRAKKLKNEEKFEEAIEILEDLFVKEPESEEIKKALINVLFSYGGYLNDDYVLEYDKSIEIFKRILEIEPNNYRVLYNLGIAYFNSGKMEDALKVYNKSISIKPDYKHCYYNIGLIYEVAKDDLEKALKYYEKALNIDPKFTYAVQARNIVRIKLDFLKRNKPKPQ